MSGSNVLRRFVSQAVVPALDEPSVADAIDDCGAFGWLRGEREWAIMLELRKKDGGATAFSCALLERVDFEPSDGLPLKFAGRLVRIVGRNLNAEVASGVSLFRGLLRHRVTWEQEMDGRSVIETAGNGVVVERFDIVSPASAPGVRPSD